jgi:hypothetical protein
MLPCVDMKVSPTMMICDASSLISSDEMRMFARLASRHSRCNQLYTRTWTNTAPSANNCGRMLTMDVHSRRKEHGQSFVSAGGEARRVTRAMDDRGAKTRRRRRNAPGCRRRRSRRAGPPCPAGAGRRASRAPRAAGLPPWPSWAALARGNRERAGCARHWRRRMGRFGVLNSFPPSPAFVKFAALAASHTNEACDGLRSLIPAAPIWACLVMQIWAGGDWHLLCLSAKVTRAEKTAIFLGSSVWRRPPGGQSECYLHLHCK